MIFLSILILIVAIALPSINKQINPILYIRISSIVFIYAGALFINALYIQSIGSGIGIYSGLFQVTTVSQLIETTYEFNTLYITQGFFFGFVRLFNNKNKDGVGRAPTDKNTSLNLKRLITKIWVNIKVGWSMPTLPKHISELDKTNYYLRLLRIIGPLSVFILMTGLGKQLNDLAYYSIFGVSLIYIIYKNIIGLFAIKQWFHYVINKDFVVRNSSLDIFSTLLRFTTSGIKATGRFTIGSGFTIALCQELDAILVKEGKTPYFVPKIKKTIQNLGLESAATIALAKLGFEDVKEIKQMPTLLSKFKSLSPEEIKKFTEESGIAYEDGVKFLEYIEANKKILVVESLKTAIEEQDTFGTNKN